MLDCINITGGVEYGGSMGKEVVAGVTVQIEVAETEQTQWRRLQQC